MDWWMLPGWCCIAIAALKLGNIDSWYHMLAFRFHFWGRKVNWNQASHVRASSVPTLYACCLTKRSCHFLFVGLCCWFCDFADSFLVAPDGPKNGTVKVLFFCSFTKVCMRSQKWDRQAVPFLGPCLGSFFEVFCIQVAEAQRFGFNEALWLMASGRATREALLSEAGFEKLFRTQNWVRRSKLFCRWFCFLLEQAGCISVAAWTQLKDVEGSFLCFRRLVAWLFAAKRRRISLVQPWVIAWSVSCWCGVCGFSRRRSASIWIIVLNTLLPLVGPPCPSRLLPKFSAQKEYELSFFQSIPLLINSINLKRDGVRICLGKDVERWSIECFLTPPSFRYRVNYIG